jgi:mRNA interferase RelE/StbE
MNYKIIFSKSFDKAFSKLDKTQKKQIQQSILNLKNGCPNIDIKNIKGQTNLYRLRSGNYRLLFKKHEQILVIEFVDIKHRKEAYTNLEKYK